jgi:hypothetical protein
MLGHRSKAQIIVENQRIGWSHQTTPGQPSFLQYEIAVPHLAPIKRPEEPNQRRLRVTPAQDVQWYLFTLNLYPRPTARLTSLQHAAGAEPMWIMVVYVLIVVVNELIVVAIGLALDRIAPLASLPVSLTLFFAVLWFGWLLAVRWTEPKHGKKSKLAPGN